MAEQEKCPECGDDGDVVCHNAEMGLHVCHRCWATWDNASLKWSALRNQIATLQKQLTWAEQKEAITQAANESLKRRLDEVDALYQASQKQLADRGWIPCDACNGTGQSNHSTESNSSGEGE